MKRAKTSQMWSYFTVIDKEYALCDSCGKKLSYKSSTTNLKKHLQNSHVSVNLSTSRNAEPDQGTCWTKTAVTTLIEAYKEERCLIDTEHPLYHNKQARMEKLLQVTRKVDEVFPGVTPEDCKTKFAFLRSQYGAELKQILQSGEGSTAWWFPLMEFLKEYLTPLEGQTSIHDNVVEVILCSEEGVEDGCNDTNTVDNSRSKTIKFPTTPCDEVASTPMITKHRRKVDEGVLGTDSQNSNKKLRAPELAPDSEAGVGRFLAEELGKIKDPFIRMRAKHKLQQVIMNAQIEDAQQME